MSIVIPTRINQTAAQWALDATVYSANKILVTTDVFYGATDQPKFKYADGTQTWAQLNYFPVSGYDDTTSSTQTQLNSKTSPSYFTHTGTSLYEAWYGSFNDVFNPTTVATAKDLMHATPFFIGRSCNLSELVIEVTLAGTAGSLIRLGICNDTGDIFPDSFISTGGTVAGDTIAVKTIAINLDITTPGLYWLVYWHNSATTITVRAINPTQGATPAYMGIAKTAFTLAPPNRILAASVFSTFPATFPQTGLTISNATIPAVLIKKSAFL